MLVTEFSTGLVEVSERFALWEETTARSHLRNWLRSDDQADFRARMRVLDLGEVQVSMLTYPHLGIMRTAKLIRQSDPEVYQVNYLLRGKGVVSLAGGEAALCSGDLVVMDSSSPYRGDVQADPGSWSHVTVQIPRRLLPLPEKSVQELLGVPMSGRCGMGGMFTRWLTDLNTRATEFTAADIPTLASVTLDLLTSVIARCGGTEAVSSPEGHRIVLRARINAFVEQHLADPAITPQSIADAHHISLRHLQQLLAEDDVSPAAWIRHRRLEQCRRDLADPRLNARPIQAIAARWGFTDPAHFSRLFRTAYGVPPRDYRNLRFKECANHQKPCANRQGQGADPPSILGFRTAGRPSAASSDRTPQSGI
ncbi:helix-turn-helix domain-containing protein [Streptomyces sp. SCA3-4]|uniref:AraC-like ligand-binding domain-containing protein n=1 Tax=Streptomyces sichuanensis TaxID=2871810 RepID=UPI001CE31B89|nr:helix-turn-helix domain-containing protein [Streptomyces sichuanensis]MCA6095520.1 helix-turn-helix domain-containing protein [Streptomyces sichuanensis]